MNQIMKNLFGFAAILLLSATVLASGKTPPRSDGFGTPQCAAYDAGSTEEHAPHTSCESCLSSHGNCHMKCFSYDYTCKATAQHEVVRLIVDPVTKQQREDRQVVEQSYSATAQTRQLAQERALYECQIREGNSGALIGSHIGWGTGACQLGSCNENSSESSRSSCR